MVSIKCEMVQVEEPGIKGTKNSQDECYISSWKFKPYFKVSTYLTQNVFVIKVCEHTESYWSAIHTIKMT